MAFASLFAGKMLGDGYMNVTHRAPRFCFIHALADKSYAEYCFHLFANYLPYGPNGMQVRSNFDRRTQKKYVRVLCQSRTSPLLERLYPTWYKRRKIIPMDWVAQNLEADGLAIWFQDDGNLKEGGRRIILSTESYTLEEKSFLRFLLQSKFNISANIDGQGRLDISSRLEVRKFQALVEPLMHASMFRKSMAEQWRQWAIQWQELAGIHRGTCRTSIYLPYDLYDRLRGEGYSSLLNNLLSEWMDKQWVENVCDTARRYRWLLKHEKIPKGKYLLTPRFRPDVKGRLDLLSMATGFERSELVIIALKQRL
ncbi:endonuclease [Desulfofundulus sp.]|uniref:endonuclease n=1 Tax=Desulfofundulus sp. TaxID=2282750 RepID=UPI003C72FF79